MSNRLNSLLAYWLETKDSHQWVLATIVETDGSSYRKPGAMMMINDLGKYYGLLSGGCLESDIMLQARRCWENGLNRIIEYDMREEEDIAWQLGIGCGGMVRILLQPVDANNQYLKLDQLYARLQNNLSSFYAQNLALTRPENSIHETEENTNQSSFVQKISPPPHLAIFGGGVDARPLVAMAAELGWQITLIDSRSAYARANDFKQATRIVHQPVEELEAEVWLQTVDAVVIMGHNIKLDAQALLLSQKSSATYVGLLGPKHRTDRVLENASLQFENLVKPLANPVGLSLGAELPETIALSILAEIQAYLSRGDGRSISGLL